MCLIIDLDLMNDENNKKNTLWPMGYFYKCRDVEIPFNCVNVLLCFQMAAF